MLFAFFGIFSSWVEVLVVIAVAATFIYILNKTAFNRLREAGSAAIGKGAKSLWVRNPIDVMQERTDKKAEAFLQKRDNLKRFKGALDGINDQVADGERKCKVLEAQASLAVDKGDDSMASQKLLQLKQEQEHLTTNKDQLAMIKVNYDNAMKLMKQEKQEIEDLRAEAERSGIQLQMSAQMRDLIDQSSSITKGLGIPGSDFSDIRNEIKNQINTNNASLSVDRDLGIDGIAQIEEHDAMEKVEASDLLAKFKQEKLVKK